MTLLNNSAPRLVVCAAVRLNETREVFCGARHGDCLNLMHRLGIKTGSSLNEMGFVDQDNVFMTRVEAWSVADKAGQIRKPTSYERNYDSHRPPNIGDEGMLFSENLY